MATQEELVRNYEILIKKSINNIKPGYFTVANRFRDEPNISERVFCYEFYYQLRNLIEKSNSDLNKEQIFFHGELPKAKYEIYGNFTPDFLIHKPEDAEFNLITIEIKAKLETFFKEGKPCGIYKDFLTICSMVQNKYKLGIFILFNNSYEEFLVHWKKYSQRIDCSHKRDFRIYSSCIKLLIKETPEAELIEKSFKIFLDEIEL